MRDIAQDTVEVMSQLVSEAEDLFEKQRGSAALGVAREIEAALVVQLEGNLGHVLLWEQFLRTPEAVAPALVSTLESLLKRDATLRGWLVEALQKYGSVVGGHK